MTTESPVTTDCPQRGAYVELVEGRLDPAAAADLRRHMGTCAACSALFAELEISAGETQLVVDDEATADTHAAEPAPDSRNLDDDAPPSTHFPPQVSIGALLDKKYLIVRLIGKGGMGSVYEAQHAGTGRRVAVKCINRRLLTRGKEGPARFRREARAAGAIDSSHIVQILDCGADDATGVLYLVMEYLQGEDLQRLLDRTGPLRPDTALRIAAQALQGLQKAHDAGIVHRDIKPANVFLACDDEGVVTVKILDFGIAKILADPTAAQSTGITLTNGFLGSPLYMSPEQVQSSKDVDHRADLWSLGGVLYCALAGAAPHDQVRGVGKLILAICASAAPPIQERAPWVPDAAAEAVHRALTIDPGARYESASAMLAAIRPLVLGGLAIEDNMLVGIVSDAPPTSGDASANQTTEPQNRTTAPEGAKSKPSGKPSSRRGASSARPAPAQPKLGATTIPTAKSSSSARTRERAAEASRAAADPTHARIARTRLAIAVAVLAAGFACFFLLVKPWLRQRRSRIAAEPLASFSPLLAAPSVEGDPLAKARIELGRALFDDVRLSYGGDVACSTCHPLDRYGADGKKTSRGTLGREPARNTLAIYNLSGFSTLLWDGRQENLYDQAKEVLLLPKTMASTKERVRDTLRAIPSYASAFAKAFPDDKEPVSFDNTARALAAFEGTLVTRGRWDRFLEGDARAISDDEKAGFNRFVEVGCIQCHYGPNVGATMFQRLGLVKPWPDSKDKGRFDITKREVDRMVFRVPTLRNVGETAPYFHDGSEPSLEAAIKIMARHQIGRELDDDDTASIASWLRCLTGDLPAKGG